VSFGPRRFAVAGPSTWNSLPSDLKSPSLTDSWTVSQPAEDRTVHSQLLCISAAVITSVIRLACI